MTLTKDQMEAAHFARQIDLDPNYKVRGEARARAIARESGVNEGQYAKRYNLGTKVLTNYTLSYSGRFTTNAQRPAVGDDVVGNIKVDSGHIATSPAYRLAMFRHR